jgi:hypothetical protein
MKQQKRVQKDGKQAGNRLETDHENCFYVSQHKNNGNIGTGSGYFPE